MRKQAKSIQAAKPNRERTLEQEMRHSLSLLILLWRATGTAIARRLNAGHAAAARRLRAHRRYLQTLIGALNAELRVRS
jgi:hypothetical protein